MVYREDQEEWGWGRPIKSLAQRTAVNLQASSAPVQSETDQCLPVTQQSAVGPSVPGMGSFTKTLMFFDKGTLGSLVPRWAPSLKENRQSKVHFQQNYSQTGKCSTSSKPWNRVPRRLDSLV